MAYDLKRTVSLKTMAMMILDTVLIALAGGLALLMRFDFSFEAVPKPYGEAWLAFLPWKALLFIAVFSLFHMYHYVWRFISAADVARMLVITVPTYVFSVCIGAVLGFHQPRSVHIIEVLLGTVLLVGSRCVLRFWEVIRSSARIRDRNGENIMLIGAGEAGRVLAREMLNNCHAKGRICCVIDDDKEKWGKFIEGVAIVGGRDSIFFNTRKYKIDQIIFAIPTASPQQRKEILSLCQKTGCRIRTLPSIYQMVEGDIRLSNVQDVKVEDLLGRDSVCLNVEALKDFLGGRTVLITGGGGSIGSELARQAAAYRPKKLILLDIYENNVYEIQQELRHIYGESLNMEVCIASVRDRERIDAIFEAKRPDIVIHAAAHKHVPLMENDPAEAVKNNIFGTYHVVCAAEKYGVKKFVLISTDKAVNPTNFMGASKRFCEMILQSCGNSVTEFCAVRFGNVLGSNGSVVPLFKKQIAEGGPVTVTDKRIIRYFMTIPEAAQLVLEAGAMAKRNEIFVLDMGEPVKILTLAENLIRLSGLEPYRDIDIREIGLRPGEKLYEELLMDNEQLTVTENEKIFVEHQSPISPDTILCGLKELDEALIRHADKDELVQIMRRLVLTYRDSDEFNNKAIRERETAVAV